MSSEFKKRYEKIVSNYETLLSRKNRPLENSNGLFERFEFPILTAEHVPYFWKYDLDEKTNPYLMERMGVNAVFNPGAIMLDGKVYLAVRVEGSDRKSFFAIAESDNGIDGFRFWDYPLDLPENDDPDTNVYDMRLVKHEDGWIYGLFCSERKDKNAPEWDTSSAVASCGIARTKDLKRWERLKDLKTNSPQQRNVVLHPEFINGKYAFYTRPQDDFIDTGKGGGIGFGLSDSIEEAVINDETIIDYRVYHTIKEVKNGLGPAPIKTQKGWINIAHGVRNTAAGLRYVLYAYLTDIDKPYNIINIPGGYFMAPEGEERIGDVSNVLFCNGAVCKDNGELLIYYASSDTRIHVARTTIDKMLDYLINTPEDPLRSRECMLQRRKIIEKNLEIMKQKNI